MELDPHLPPRLLAELAETVLCPTVMASKSASMLFAPISSFHFFNFSLVAAVTLIVVGFDDEFIELIFDVEDGTQEQAPPAQNQKVYFLSSLGFMVMILSYAAQAGIIRFFDPVDLVSRNNPARILGDEHNHLGIAYA